MSSHLEVMRDEQVKDNIEKLRTDLDKEGNAYITDFYFAALLIGSLIATIKYGYCQSSHAVLHCSFLLSMTMNYFCKPSSSTLS